MPKRGEQREGNDERNRRERADTKHPAESYTRHRKAPAVAASERPTLAPPVRATLPSKAETEVGSLALAQLERALAVELSSDGRAAELIAAAISDSGATAPRDAKAVQRFVRTHLGPRLEDAVGAASAKAILSHMGHSMEGRTSAPPSQRRRPPPRSSTKPSMARPAQLAPRQHARPAVIVLDRDRYRRSAIARRLVAGGCDVVACEQPSELLAMLGTDAAVDAILVASAPALKALALTVRVARPGVPVLVVCEAADALGRASAPVEAHSVDPPEPLIARLHQIAAGEGRR